MNIRFANTDDAEQIVKAINDLIMELGGATLPLAEAEAMCERVIAGDLDGAIVVANDGDQLVGVCTVSFQAAIRTLGKYAIIQEMYVAPEHRNGGLGAQLVDAAAEEAVNRECKIVELGTSPDAERFYERIGFTQVGRRLRRELDSSE